MKTLKDYSYKQMYLINKFEKDILETTMNNLKESDKIIHDKPILKDVATEPFKNEDKLLPPITSNETEINDEIEGQSNNIESTNVLDTPNMS